MLVFWFWREIVFDVTYIFRAQYSCMIVSVFWLWQEKVFKMRTRFIQKNLFGLLFYDSLADVCFLTLTARGLEELFSSCAVVSVFGSGGK